MTIFYNLLTAEFDGVTFIISPRAGVYTISGLAEGIKSDFRKIREGEMCKPDEKLVVTPSINYGYQIFLCQSDSNLVPEEESLVELGSTAVNIAQDIHQFSDH